MTKRLLPFPFLAADVKTRLVPLILLALLSVAAAPEPVQGWVRLPTETGPTPSSAHALAYDSNRGVVVKFGGYGDAGFLAETWELDLRQRPLAWVQRFPAHAPSARSLTSMAFDEARGVTVLFGGNSGDPPLDYLNDTWLWDGQDWSEVVPPSSPSRRRSSGLTYDSLRQVVVLFGGSGCCPPAGLDDLWEWDGQTWSERLADTRPPGRRTMAFSYDRGRDALVVFGGATLNDFLDDTWEWTNGGWVERQPATRPPARTVPTAAYSAVGGYTLIFGGQDDFGIRHDTWLWDGLNWSPTGQERHPSGRISSQAVYLPRRGILLHGGLFRDAFTYLNDTWVYRDP